MAKKTTGISKSLDDRFTTGGKGVFVSPNTPAQQKVIDKINAEMAKKKPVTKKKTK